MENRKMKLWKKCLILLLVLLCIFVAITTRKVIILSNLDKKVTAYENNNKNIYIKTLFNFSNYTSEMKRFIKDDVDKMVLEKTDINGNKTKIIQITYPTKRKIFTEINGNKVMNVYEEAAAVRGSHIENSTTASYTTIMNFAYSINLPERVLNSLVTKIKLVEIDGKKCYELSSLFNTNFLYDQNTTKLSIYVEKDTGLPVKMIQDTTENNDIQKNITIYEYKFDVVTDADMQEPDNSEYKLQK